LPALPLAAAHIRVKTLAAYTYFFITMPANAWAISARTSGRAPTAKGTLTSWLTGANSKDKPNDWKEPSSTLTQDATAQAANARLVWSGEFDVNPFIVGLPLFPLFFFQANSDVCVMW